MKKILYVFCVSCILFSCNIYKDVEFRGVENFKLKGMEGKQASFTLDLVLYNPNGYALKLKPSDMDVYLEDTHFGLLHLDEKVRFKRKSESTVTVPLTGKLNPGVLLKVPVLIGKQKVNVRAKGKVKGGVWFVSKQKEIDETRTIDTQSLNFLK